MPDSRTRKLGWGFVLFFAPVFLWLFLLFVLPHLELLRLSFVGTDYYGKSGVTLDNYAAFFTEPAYWSTLLRTAVYSLIVTAIILVLALPMAFYITKVVGLRVRGLLTLMIVVPFWVSLLVRVYGWMIILRESGIINRVLVGLGIWQTPLEMLYTDASLMIGLIHTNLLFMLVPIMGVMDSLDNALIEAGSNLGASKFMIWWKIILPHCMTGIMSGSIIVFMLVTGSYIAPALMGGKNSLWFTQQIYNQFIIAFNWNQGAAFGFLLLATSSLIVWIALRVSGQKLGEVVQ
ncbi:MAG TPA: ABC transporter permease [Sedimentisphaerales bacterium]|nr:ABC transporter permease [Sedimentisphaerales bacterium]